MEGWPETYTVEGSVIDAQMRADPDQSARLRELRIVTESGLPVLETEAADQTIYWAYHEHDHHTHVFPKLHSGYAA